MRRFVTIPFLLLLFLPAMAQRGLSLSSELEERILSTGLIHTPLPLDTTFSNESRLLSKKVMQDTPFTGEWNMKGVSFTGQRAVGSPDDPDYATYGECRVDIPLGGISLEDYNRIVFTVRPDCDAVWVTGVNLSVVNEGTGKKGYNPPPGSHLLNLTNHKDNVCVLEIADLQRDNVSRLQFSTSLKGKSLPGADSLRFVIKDMHFQKIGDPDILVGWQPRGIVLSHSGYGPSDRKRAILRQGSEGGFSIIDSRGVVRFRGTLSEQKTTLGSFKVADFSSFSDEGTFVLEAAGERSRPFRISTRVWEDSQWKVLSGIFSQRCGYAVPGVHGRCHEDLLCVHDGVSVSYGGGWHDAGDLSQQTLQTADVMFSLLEASQAVKETNPALSSRLREEARWGLDFVLRCRFGDGYHASSMGLLIWQDGKLGTLDDIVSVRKQNFAFDNFLYSAYEAYASSVMTEDPVLQEHLLHVAQEDFSFAWEKFSRDGYDRFVQPYEHTYNTSHSQFQATIALAASRLFALTGQEIYKVRAQDAIGYVLKCQRRDPVGGISGFFYRDESRRSIVHYIHQSREQVYAEALVSMCRTFPDHPDRGRWKEALSLYGEYLKSLMEYTAPYGMIPSGVYGDSEYNDVDNFYALHLFPPEDAPQRYVSQIKGGVKIDSHHYVKRFPVWFNIFNGNNAVILSMGKAAALCGRFLGDDALLQIGREQLYWIVGMNPFSQSMIYGEGYDYPQMSSFSSGEYTGEMPVGIRTLGDGDEPYWPQINTACYKEVWVTVAGKWLSLSSEYVE